LGRISRTRTSPVSPTCSRAANLKTGGRKIDFNDDQRHGPTRSPRTVRTPSDVMVAAARSASRMGLHVRRWSSTGEAMLKARVEFGLYDLHCARPRRQETRRGLYDLTQLGAYLEARLWNDVFLRCGARAGFTPWDVQGTIPDRRRRCPAACSRWTRYHLRALARPHIVGLNRGRWGYILVHQAARQ